MANAPMQPVRSVVKGSGQWLDVIMTNPDTNQVLSVQAFTLEQLQNNLAGMTAQFNAQVASINQMIAMLTPPVTPTPTA